MPLLTRKPETVNLTKRPEKPEELLMRALNDLQDALLDQRAIVAEVRR